jgi:hypothetical protein
MNEHKHMKLYVFECPRVKVLARHRLCIGAI